MIQRRIFSGLLVRLGLMAALLLPAGSWAAFMDPGYGVRPQGMGGAFTAISDDVNAFLFNPAGAVQAQSHQTSFMHAKLFLGLGDEVDLSLNSALSLFSLEESRIPLDAFGAGWTNFRAPVYREDTVYLLGALSLRRFFPELDSDLSFGFNMKMLRTRYDLDLRAQGDTLFASEDGKAVLAADLGLWSRPDPGRLPGLRFGVSLRNLNRPDVGLQTEDPVPQEVAAGLAYDFKYFTAALDAMSRESVLTVRGGVESWFMDKRVGLRAGANEDDVAVGLTYVFGLGERLKVNMDYAFSVPMGVDNSGGSHRIGVGTRF